MDLRGDDDVDKERCLPFRMSWITGVVRGDVDEADDEDEAWCRGGCGCGAWPKAAGAKLEEVE